MPTTTLKKTCPMPGANKHAPALRASVKKPALIKTPSNKVKEMSTKLTTFPVITIHTPKTKTSIVGVTLVDTNKSDSHHIADALEAYRKQVSLQVVGVTKHTQAHEEKRPISFLTSFLSLGSHHVF
jgi:capsular polysaccharide biosynthesis protein